MTLFETLPQFTMFVLFFMLGFVTRFFTQIAMLVCGTLARTVEKQIVSACQKVRVTVKNAYAKKVAKANLADSKSKNRQNKIENRSKRGKSDVSKWKFCKILKPDTAILEVIYFVALGVLTIATFSMFEYVDFFWFIPLAVILGVVANDYLTKEVFAKRKII